MCWCITFGLEIGLQLNDLNPLIIIYVSLVQLRYKMIGIGIRGLMRGMTTLPQGNKELLVVRDKVGRPPGELGVSKSMECDIFPSVL